MVEVRVQERRREPADVVVLVTCGVATRLMHATRSLVLCARRAGLPGPIPARQQHLAMVDNVDALMSTTTAVAGETWPICSYGSGGHIDEVS